jgi:hypothetical protein
VDDKRIDTLVRQAAPVVELGPAVELDRTLQLLAADVMKTEAAPVARGATVLSSRRWRPRAVVPLAAGIVLATAAAGFTQWYDTNTADFGEALQQYTAELPLPPGADREAYVADVQAQGLERPMAVSDVSTRSMVAYYGFCTWAAAWDVRNSGGDVTGAAEAVTALRAAAAVPGLSRTDGGGVVTNLEQVADAAARGDRQRVAMELKNNCSGLPLDGIR